LDASLKVFSLPLARASLLVLCARGFGGLRSLPARTLAFNAHRVSGFAVEAEGRGGGLGCLRVSTLLRALFSSAGAGEFVGLCARYLVGGVEQKIRVAVGLFPAPKFGGVGVDVGQVEVSGGAVLNYVGLVVISAACSHASVRFLARSRTSWRV
jgi:hypothetical protein